MSLSLIMKELNMPKKLIAALVLIAGSGLALFSQLYASEESLVKAQSDAKTSMSDMRGSHAKTPSQWRQA